MVAPPSMSHILLTNFISINILLIYINRTQMGCVYAKSYYLNAQRILVYIGFNAMNTIIRGFFFLQIIYVTGL